MTWGTQLRQAAVLQVRVTSPGRQGVPGRGTLALMLACVLTLLLSCRRRRRHLHPRAKVAFYCRGQLLRLVAVVVVVALLVVACTSLMQISICVRQHQQQ